MMMYKDITGIILSGGFSSRMGADKALLVINGQTIIERIVNLLSSLFENILIITNSPAEYNSLNVPLYEDVYKHKGPLSGIHSGLVNSKTQTNFFISCDAPLVTEQLIKYVVDYSSDKPVKYCADSNHQYPLIGVYSNSLIPDLENLFNTTINGAIEKDKKYSINSFLKNFETEIIQVENLPFYSEKLFFNVNTPDDYLKLKEYFNINY